MENNQYKRRNDLAWQTISERIIILDSQNLKSLELNETASFLWLQLDEQKSFQGLLECLLENFDVTRQQATDDLQKALKLFGQYELLQ